MNDADNLAMLGRVMGGLIVVLVLIGLVARVARRTRGGKSTSGLRVIDRIGLSREANLTVVGVANRVLLLGVTAQGVTMLADLDATLDARRGPVLDADQGRILDADPDPIFDAGPGVVLDVARSGEVDRATELDVDHGSAQDDQELAQRAMQMAREQTLANPTRGIVRDRKPPDAEPRSQRRPVPTGVALEEYPDLASALRAAGRTSGSSSAATTSGRVITTTEAAGAPSAAAPAPAAPRTRAEARAEARARAAAEAQSAEQAAVRQAAAAQTIPTPGRPAPAPFAQARPAPAPFAQARPAPAPFAQATFAPAPSAPNPSARPTSKSMEIDRIPVQRSQSETAAPEPVVPPPTAQASGSVLSPRTWRQGIEALRDLTVRRG